MGTLGTIAHDLIGINRKSTFNLEEARAILPFIFRLTHGYAERVQVLIAKIETASKLKSDPELTEPLEAEAGRLIMEWQSKIQKLGGTPNGHWIVDFDSGDGYFCWKYPEPVIDFWHHYRDGFSKRVKLSALNADTTTLTPIQDRERSLHER